jgi:CubicO group peptidase (beta-lactamase class C family)
VSDVRDGDAWLPVASGWSQVGDGGLRTTPTELALWGGQYWAPTVGSATVNEAREAGAVPTGEVNDERYGAGVRYSEVPGLGRVIGHVGAWEAFVTTVDVVPHLELAIAATCASPDLPPVRPGIGLDILRLWAEEA